MTFERPTGLQAPVKLHHFQRVMGNQSWCLIFSQTEWGHLLDVTPDGVLESVFNSLRGHIILTLFAGKQGLSSNQASIGMDISLQKTCFSRLTMQLIFLRARPKAIHRVFFSLIMPFTSEEGC
jgi:hypothetical protein